MIKVETKYDGPDVLIHTIRMQIIENPKEEMASTNLILSNLRCTTLSDYHWYKDVFITNVLKRDDCNAHFWKERFIVGIPKLFAERILNKMHSEVGSDIIPFS